MQSINTFVTKVKSCIIPDFKPNAAEKLWIVGDKFVATSAKENFMNRTMMKGYANTNFDVTIMTGNYLSDAYRHSPIARIRNAVVNLVNKQLCLPKWIIIVPENGVISGQNYNKIKDGPTLFYGSLLEWCMTSHDKLFEDFKRHFTTPALKHGWPHIMWVLPSLHVQWSNINARKKFNRSLVKVAASHESTITVDLETNWNFNDTNYVIPFNQRFTSDGYATYWQAMDQVIKWADTKVNRNSHKQLHDLFKPMNNKIKEANEAAASSRPSNSSNSKYETHDDRNNYHNGRYWGWRGNRRNFRGHHDTRYVIDRRRSFNFEGGKRLPPPPEL